MAQLHKQPMQCLNILLGPMAGMLRQTELSFSSFLNAFVSVNWHCHQKKLLLPCFPLLPVSTHIHTLLKERLGTAWCKALPSQCLWKGRSHFIWVRSAQVSGRSCDGSAE